MKITIVYESMFGTTHEVAEAISEGARRHSRTPMWDAWLWQTLRQS
jgi:hypothetical protein